MPSGWTEKRETSASIDRRLVEIAAARKASGGFRLSESDCWGVPSGTLTNYAGEQVKHPTRGLRSSRPKKRRPLDLESR